MIALLLFASIWSLNDLKPDGLTQNKPGFPFSVNLIRVAGFCCGLIGCVIELIRYFDNELIDEALDLILLLSGGGLIAVVMFIVFECYHSKYNQLDDDIDTKWAIRCDKDDDHKFKVIALSLEESRQRNSMQIWRAIPRDVCDKQTYDYVAATYFGPTSNRSHVSYCHAEEVTEKPVANPVVVIFNKFQS